MIAISDALHRRRSDEQQMNFEFQKPVSGPFAKSKNRPVKKILPRNNCSYTLIPQPVDKTACDSVSKKRLSLSGKGL
jgi:hypothetical protein